MKQLFCVLLMSLLSIYCVAQSLTFSNTTPEQGRSVKFSYNPQGGNLGGMSNITCIAKLVHSRDSWTTQKIKLVKIGNVYEGELLSKDSTNFASLKFTANDNIDENANGYFTKFYKEGKPTAMAFFLEGFCYTVEGKNMAGLKPNYQKAVALFKTAFARDAKLKELYNNNYLISLYNIDPNNGSKAINEAIVELNQIPSEANALKAVSLYHILKNKAAVDSTQNAIKLYYPKGTYALNTALSEISKIKGGINKETRLNEILTNFNLSLSNNSDVIKVSRVFLGLGVSFLDVDFAKVEFYVDKIPSKTMRAMLYNSFSWKDTISSYLPYYERFSKKAISLIDSAKNEIVTNQYLTPEEYVAELDETKTGYEVVYAGVLDQTGKILEALSLVENAAKKSDFQNLDFNVKYVDLLVKNGRHKDALNFAERFVKDGQKNDQLKANLKFVYTGVLPFDKYYSNLESEALVLLKAKFYKEMIKIPAPLFSLVNLQGQNIELAKLKGKVVIIDYWATWCGPCIQSFPGMQKAVDKYKSDPSVVFLFINTWQREDDRNRLVKDWIAKTNYSFNVLLDNKNKIDTDVFDVVSSYKVEGLPTKFIIDGNGIIRFKKVGFEGTAESVVSELDMMIALAKDGQEASK
ncbi:MAG: TlpA family protein disulfide reductase [Flavobacterium sp.]|nr:MAG: TlpA family protein disulfide reductase [Flavobacterium sp.]